MLVLTRKLGEEVQIGDNIKVVVLKVDGQKVRLGIEAPQEVNIRRPEAAPKKAEFESKEAAPAASQMPRVATIRTSDRNARRLNAHGQQPPAPTAPLDRVRGEVRQALTEVRSSLIRNSLESTAGK
jgi:carbon storage regulator CsrA